MPPTTRFAPSPTGYLHLGHAYAALIAWRRARASGGRFLLRLEDIDRTRCRPDFAAAILEDLAWLGLDWDGGVRVQSEHEGEYAAALASLAARGLTYPCFCSRAEIAASAPHADEYGPVYPGTCRDLPAAERLRRQAAGQPFVVRLAMARALAAARFPVAFDEEGEGRIDADPRPFGDVVLARRDAAFSYHLCVTHDDAAQGVSLVTRAVDLRPVTGVHRLLQMLMGWPAPRYAHHPLLTDATGRRLAKRDRAVTLRALRGQGLSPAAVRALAGSNELDGVVGREARF